MGQETGIGWTDHTCNFWWGCSQVSPECDQCYIKSIMKRAGIPDPFLGPIRTKHWETPPRWNRAAKREAVRRRVFTCSMSDFFHAGANAWREEAWQVIRDCAHLDWLVLTKRASQIRHCVAHFFKQFYQDERGFPCTDGMLDGVCNQAWPAPRARSASLALAAIG